MNLNIWSNGKSQVGNAKYYSKRGLNDELTLIESSKICDLCIMHMVYFLLIESCLMHNKHLQNLNSYAYHHIVQISTSSSLGYNLELMCRESLESNIVQ